MKLKTHWFIHIFAVLHFLTSLVCGLLCTSDALLLTVLTIALTLIICLRGKMSVELTVITIVLANVLGYVLGSLLAWLFGLVMDGPVIVHAISTAATTEALGWAMLWFTGRYHDSDQELPEEERDTRLGWLIFAVVAVYLLRVFINLIFSASASGPGEGLTEVKDFLYNPLMLLLIVAGSVIFIQYYKRENKAMSYSGKILSYALYFIFMTLLSALFVGLGLPFSFDVGFSASRLLLLLAVSLVTNAAAFCFVYVADLALTARRKLEIEREKADKARYQYLLLKQQLSPHFLFNSLNVLDALVLDGSKEDASRFIHQLSGIYRYMLRNEDEEVVPLHEEMAYSDMYGSLVKMRWQDSLVIESSVREEDLGHYVIPCSVQLCIENAIKHNSMSPENPLRISISSDGRFVKVSNRLAPKLTGLRSTGLGLKYIKQQYLSHGSSVEVERGEDIFEVKLPLL